MRMLSVVCFVLVLGISCQSPDLVAQKDFPNTCWALQDTLKLTHRSDGNSPNMRLYTEIREDYEFRNLYVKIRALSPSGTLQEALVVDTLQDEAGNWRVEKSGSAYPIWFMHLPELNLEEAGDWQLQVIPYMRRDTLCEIETVGWRWE